MLTGESIKLTTKVKTKIDRFGRIVIPKKMRSDFGLKKDSKVILEAGKNGIIVHADTSHPFVKGKDGIIVVLL